MITWVVGGGGLLGRAIRSQCAQTFTGAPVPWLDPSAAAQVLMSDAARFTAAAGDEPWSVVWAAGAATVSSSPQQAESELAVLESLLDALNRKRPSGPGVVFLTSSAGGVYAGSADPPFDASTAPVALSPYGELKLAQENLAAQMAEGLCPLVIGRLSNLYGPGQNLDKLQGLVSRLALSAATRQPINIFVPLDTIRDYIYVDDAAHAVIAAIASAAAGRLDEHQVLVLASGQPVTVGQLIRTMNQVTKTRIPVALGSHPSAGSQSLDLRLVPWSGVRATTPLPVGAKAVYLNILESVQRASLPA